MLIVQIVIELRAFTVHNDVAPLKIITYRAIKMTGTLIVIAW
jgi:hypothetical protein